MRESYSNRKINFIAHKEVLMFQNTNILPSALRTTASRWLEQVGGGGWWNEKSSKSITPNDPTGAVSRAKRDSKSILNISREPMRTVETCYMLERSLVNIEGCFNDSESVCTAYRFLLPINSRPTSRRSTEKRLSIFKPRARELVKSSGTDEAAENEILIGGRRGPRANPEREKKDFLASPFAEKLVRNLLLFCIQNISFLFHNIWIFVCCWLPR